MNTQKWSPMYFLAALGAGGMVVTFFMYLMFWVPHPGQPVPVFEDWTSAFLSGGYTMKLAIFAALVGIVFFMSLHFKLLAGNLFRYRQFRHDGSERAIIGTNAHTQLMAIPLTLAMSVNTLFIVALVFVPGLWKVVEYMFPLAIAVFLAIGVWAVRIYLSFFGEVLASGSFKSDANNSFAQMLPAFSFSMIGVGLAAPAAMSQSTAVVGTSIVLSIFFISGAVLLSLLNIAPGFEKLLSKGASVDTLPTLWVGIPILTVVGIAVLRLNHGLHTIHVSEGGSLFVVLATIVAVQLLFALMGWAVMRRMGYFGRLLKREEASPVAFALICPGVALTVMGHFFVNKGLVSAHIVEKFDVTWIVIVTGLTLLQVATGWLLLRLTSDVHPSPTPHQARVSA